MYKFDDSGHLHSLDGKPLVGTSSVSSIVSKGGALTWWASAKAVEVLGWMKADMGTVTERLQKAGDVLNLLKNLDAKAYLGILDKAYKNHQTSLKDSADKGTDLHFALETYVKAKMFAHEPIAIDPKILSFAIWCDANVKRFLWSEVHCYNEDLWIGGISDLGVELNNGETGILDFKSSKDAYFEQFMQCGGYAWSLERNGGFTADGKDVFTPTKPFDFYGIVPFGAEDKTPRIRHDVLEFKEAFLHALYLYKLKNKFEGK